MPVDSIAAGLTSLIAPACVLAGVVVALVRRRRAISRGLRPSVMRSAVAVVNGAAVGLAVGILLGLLGLALTGIAR